MKSEDIISVFEKHGIRIELGANFSAKGQIAQLINGTQEVIDQQAQRISGLEALITQFMKTKTTGDMYQLFSAVDGRGASLDHIKADAVEDARAQSIFACFYEEGSIEEKAWSEALGQYDDYLELYANNLRNCSEVQ